MDMFAINNFGGNDKIFNEKFHCSGSSYSGSKLYNDSRQNL